jgi:hypothetical protein
VPAFIEFWTRAAELPRSEQEALWHGYVRRHPDVVNELTRAGISQIDAGQALATYPRLLPRIVANAGRASGWLDEAAAAVLPLLEADDREVTCKIIIGLARSNGWVTMLDGSPTIFIAIEQIPNHDAARILTAHEMAHACQWPEDGAGGRDERLGRTGAPRWATGSLPARRAIGAARSGGGHGIMLESAAVGRRAHGPSVGQPCHALVRRGRSCTKSANATSTAIRYAMLRLNAAGY